MMKIGAYEQVQKLYEDSVSKRNADPFAVSEENTKKAEPAAVYTPSSKAQVRNDENSLSDAAKKLLEKLREKYKDMDVMVADYGSEEEAQSILSAGTHEYSILITTDELEKMAADEEYQTKIQDQIDSSIEMMKGLNEKITEQLGEDSDVRVTQIGITVGEDGKVSIFATLEKMSEKQKEHIEQVKEERSKEKAEAKRVEKKYTNALVERKMAKVTGTTEEEILEAITGIDWSQISGEQVPVAGAKIDFKA